MKKVVKIIIITMVVIPISVNAGKGCCSSHGGVVGCDSSGRQICKDGSLSPSCTCIPEVTDTYGCTDRTAKNYNSSANKEDGSCIYYVYGCMDKNAKNYNPSAEKEDNSCEYYVLGCTDPKANNYNPKAEKDDNSCILPTEDDSTVKTSSDKTNDNGILDTAIGLGVISGGVYLYTKKKKK